MESICINCKHFVKGSFHTTTHIWGDCRKSANGTGQAGSEIPDVFKWAHDTCSDFKPKQEAES